MFRTPLIQALTLPLAVMLTIMVQLGTRLALAGVPEARVDVSGSGTRKRVGGGCALGVRVAVYNAVVIECGDALGVFYDVVAVASGSLGVDRTSGT